MARPKEFEPEEALEKAMHQFWAKGYHDTSIRDLVERTGVNYYGLYAAFESKHGLFLAALDQYRDTVTAEIASMLRRPGPARATIRGALDRLLALMKTRDGHVGCMMCNTAIEVAPYDAQVAAKVQAHMATLQAGMRAKLLEGRDAGEIEEDTDIDALAEFLAATAYSLGLLLRSGADDARLGRHLDTALSTIR
ncbi:MAG: TetR family transcriptional regulator [Pseudomonadota bacterium]